MNINLDKHEVGLILDALEDFQTSIKLRVNDTHSLSDNRYLWTENDVTNLRDQLNDILETTHER
jgi:hypothetical protein